MIPFYFNRLMDDELRAQDIAFEYRGTAYVAFGQSTRYYLYLLDIEIKDTPYIKLIFVDYLI